MATIESIRKLADRIRLVNATADHAHLLNEIFTGANTRKFSPVADMSAAELAERLRHGGKAFSEHAAFYRFFGEYGDALFGTFVVKNIEWDTGRAEVGFSLLDKWQGQGLGSALVYKCVATIFTESTIDKLWATVSITNEACRRLLHSLGFEDCGPYEQAFIINGEPVPQLLFRLGKSQADDRFLS